jgi:hypothetical protein
LIDRRKKNLYLVLIALQGEKKVPAKQNKLGFSSLDARKKKKSKKKKEMR